MHGYSQHGNGRFITATPYPPSSPRLRRKPNVPFSAQRAGPILGVLERVLYVIVSVVLKKRGVLLLAPLLYIFGMLYMGLRVHVSWKDGGGGPRDQDGIRFRDRGPPGSVYRSPEVFEGLWPYMQMAESNASRNMLMSVWDLKFHQSWKPCSRNNVSEKGPYESNGFFIIEANGGLNQQRLSICDAVAVAGLLNATLVIPYFHLNSVWQDSSKFGDIFDEDYFIDLLRSHVIVVRELPKELLEQFGNNVSNIVNLRLKAWSSPSYYIKKVLPKLIQRRAVRVAPFSNRLAHAVPPNVQGLRCLANFEALRFSQPVRTLAEKMVGRMIKNSSQSGGRYVSVHLRFEMDMVAFSCCEYDGGEEERHEMDIARERGWRGKFRKRGRVIRPGENRMDGKCPLTPLEVGMMLRGMGFDNTTSLYVAAGDIYKEEKFMAPLKQMFPLLETKHTLANEDELAPFKGYSSRLAALDYTVCLHSEVFVTTQGGNFPHFLMGHRRYLYGGHAKTIKPNKRKLALIFDQPTIRSEVFKRQMKDMLHHNDMKGSEERKPTASLYTFPMPDCMCTNPEGR